MTRVFLSHWLLQQIVHGQEGVVLLLLEGPQIPDRAEGNSGHRGRFLESNRLGQGGLQYQRMGGAAGHMKKTLDFYKAGHLVAVQLYSSHG